MRWLRRSATGLLAGTCLAGIALSGCGAGADTGGGAPSVSSSAATPTATPSATPPAGSGPSGSTAPLVGTARPSSAAPPSITARPSSAVPPSITVPAAPSGGEPPTASGSVPPISLGPPIGTPRAPLTLTGTVQEGAEASCLLLKDEKTGLQVNLSGATEAIRVGSHVTVTGRIHRDLMSYCQQGPIFVVSSATVSPATVSSATPNSVTTIPATG